MKSKNIILFLMVCFLAGGLIFSGKINLEEKISLEVLDLFPQDKDRKFLDIYRQIGDSSLVFVAQNQEISDESFQAFLNQVQELPNTQEIIQKTSSSEASEFILQNYFYLGTFAPSKLSAQEMEEKILNDFSQKNLNPIDPLQFIQMPNFSKSLEIHSLPLAIIKLKSSDLKEIRTFYDQFSSLAQSFGITHYFSPSFIDAINPQLILDEVNLLGAIALAFFALLYFLILRMPFLTLNSILTILTSNFIAILVLLYIYPQVSIMSLSFGIGISNICIDYMMHHHFLGYYLKGKTKFNPSVFYGFITTMIGFFVCLFVPFPLLSQLSLYTIINLSIAYLCFAFLYQSIGFSTPKYYPLINKLHTSLIPPLLVIALSIGMGTFALSKLQRDLDLSKLDYQNQNFEEQKKFFSALDQKVFLIRASEINTLIQQAQEIAKISPESVGILGLLPTQKEIKKRERYFKSPSFTDEKQKFKNAIYRLQKINPDLASILKNAYRYIPAPPALNNLEDLEHLGINVIQIDKEFYFQGSIDDLSTISHLYGIYTKQPQEIIQEITNSVYAPMVSILILAFVAIVILLLVISGKRFFDALTFVLFPISSILLYLALLQIPINIMHLFAMLLVVVVGVDYGIYHVKEKDDFKSKHAVLFSTLTTLCSFGLFLFSQTKALNSFGEVVSMGMICILVLIFLQKDFAREINDAHDSQEHPTQNAFSMRDKEVDDLAWLDEVQKKTQQEIEASKRTQAHQVKPRSQAPQHSAKDDHETLYF